MQEGIYHDNFKGHAHPLEAKNKTLRTRLAESERRRVDLVEAVKEYLKADDEWYGAHQANDYEGETMSGEYVKACRAEVDRLIANEPEPAE